MGYTHYFDQKSHPTKEQWKAICDDFKQLRVVALIKELNIPIQREYDSPGPVEVSNRAIIFNGVGDNGHETMVVESHGAGFQFCKTNGKPYDFYVVALLLIMNKHAPDVWEISSDGDEQDWMPVQAWMEDGGLGVFPLPKDVANA